MLEGWPGEQLLIKLWDTISGGIGAGLRPRQILREEAARTEVRRRDLLIISQAERDAGEIRSGKKTLERQGDELILLPAPEAPVLHPEPGMVERIDVVKDHQKNLEFNEFKRLLNLTKIGIFAEEEAEEMR